MTALHQARRVIALEIEALQRMAERLGTDFEQAVDVIRHARGRVIVIGMGKSGHVGRKIAATMASTGTPAFFVHPAEAFHGDLGMIQPEDVVLLISNSGETEELVRLLPFLRQQGNGLVAMTGKARSTLARHADVVLDISVEVEACSNNLAPTSSTTATLVMGDALAVTLSVSKGFQPEDFARFHPGGALGQRLQTRVEDRMTSYPLPICGEHASFSDVVHTIGRGRLGLALVCEERRLIGLITDGDLRRALQAVSNPMKLRAVDMMTREPLTVPRQVRMTEADDLMRGRRVTALVVTDEHGLVEGVVQLLATSDGAAGDAAPVTSTSAAAPATPLSVTKPSRAAVLPKAA
jgi:arabinose-5-phosphate isomerase